MYSSSECKSSLINRLKPVKTSADQSLRQKPLTHGLQMSIFDLAMQFFLLTNPIGNAPAILSMLKDFDFSRQKWIIMREGIIALFLALFFQFFGTAFLGALHIDDYALRLAGGVIILITALGMIFSGESSAEPGQEKQEPFIVPIATPLLSGSGLFSIIMIYSRIENDDLKISSAILLAWVGILAVLYASPYLMRLLGKCGLAALEQIMGLLLAFMATELILIGTATFIKTFKLLG